MQARESKPEPTVHKTEPDVFQLEKCYRDALEQVAPEMDLHGLSTIEYGTMCLYYDSQTYPNQFLERVEEGDTPYQQDEEYKDGEELDEIL